MKWLTPDRFAAAMDRKAKALKTAVRAGMANTLADAHAEAVKRSSGTLTSGMLREMGHPYAVRDPQTPLDPTTVNMQTGEFRRAWRKAGPRQRGGGYGGEVTNDNPIAKYMFGTRKMIARRVDTATADAVRPRFRKRMRAALKAGLEA